MFDYFLIPEGYSEGQIGWIVTAIIIGGTIGNITAGYIAKKYFKQQLLHGATFHFFFGTLFLFLFTGSFPIHASDPILYSSSFLIVYVRGLFFFT